MARKISIDPITRLEGHGKIEIFLNEDGNVEKAYFQIPELRGFEKFSEGRLAEDMPQITERICGVCPWAHHMASSKALDDLYQVDPPPAAKKIRELIYNVFILEDHAFHFFFLGGPDFITDPQAPTRERNILGVIQKVGKDVGKRVIGMRKELRDLEALVGGKTIHPVCGLPGGISKSLTEEDREEFIQVADHALEFTQFTLDLFKDLVLGNDQYVDLIRAEAYTHRTYYMGLVDENNQVNFYDGTIRVVDPQGSEFAKFTPQQYVDNLSEHIEPWTYVKFPYLKEIGWKGFVDGKESGIFSVAPLARLNAAHGMATPRAQEAYQEMYETLDGKPVHHTLANHWARVIEMVYGAERIKELAEDEEITSSKIRELPQQTPAEGMGVVEAPRGTLFHHYLTNEQGVIQKANLIVATQNNSARMAMSIDKAAKELITQGEVDEGLLNMVEMAFRAYDPCHACATHTLPGQMPLKVNIYDHRKELVTQLKR